MVVPDLDSPGTVGRAAGVFREAVGVPAVSALHATTPITSAATAETAAARRRVRRAFTR
ncbi:hypothetical protein [Kibdelosporangium philippinense]|uniref:hypothetical protein n=1 Tax=Kibdelosporangium philippinense TaxID=211113 RepID=UPI00360BF547